MHTFLIERDIAGAGDLSPADLQGIASTSCRVLDALGPGIEWLHSYVTGSRVYCVYRAENEALIRRHAELGGFPLDRIARVEGLISPASAR
ncbi:DUF4242 domain-containing protein [Aquimonas voraii]|uniref:DUF4242 domain-containing protein n=1 Tax=Aquimonas voraii TaxID=265719 RepID=A0A1G6VJS7_9GAMM|nr:DUF4242 domain-containing protein [Aquimonas voraii]SDD53809.1 Protein of unknown function [Aquimonas voraii]